MIIWLNGPFGGGKTTTARAMIEQRSPSRIFDPEHVGYMLQSNFRDHTFDDFQDLPPWRMLVPSALEVVATFTEMPVVAPQSVLRKRYWEELHRSMADRGLDVVHVVLDADVATLTDRIDTDQEEAQARQWRLDHLQPYLDARSWLHPAADLVVDTTEATSVEVADQIWAAAGR